ncbi:MAG: DUF2069 domain-containing protein [Gammaproteobacteria bacterium]
MNRERVYYFLTLLGYFTTMFILLAWYGWLNPPKTVSPSIVVTLLSLPLFFALRGMLHGRVYTVSWSLFLSMFYFCHGVIEAWSSAAARPYAIIEICASLSWLIAGILYIRAIKGSQTKQPV